MSAPRIAVIGAAGFVGRATAARIAAAGAEVLPVDRASLRAAGVPDGDIAACDDWTFRLAGCEAVVHLAARAHVLDDTEPDPLAAFRRTNVKGALAVAEGAERAGVKRLVFVSSIGVHGIDSGARAWNESDPAAPAEPYAVSKWEAEQALREFVAGTSMSLVVVRPPLVHGPGVKGNMLRLLRFANSGVPLPIGAFRNARSLVGVANLADFLYACATHSAAAGETFVVADGEDLSTADLLRRLARGLGRAPRLPAVPPALVRALATLAGRRRDLDRLVGNLRVDASRARERLGWRPPTTLDAGLVAMTDWYRRQSTP